MNKSEFLKALAALPPEYKPEYNVGQLQYSLGQVPNRQWFCPLTAVANAYRPIPANCSGSMDVSLGASVLHMPLQLGWKIAHAADDRPTWHDGLFKRRIRRIFKKQFEAAYPNLGKST